MDNFKKVYTVAVTVIITALLTFMASSAYYSGKLFVKPGYGTKLNTVEGILDKYYYEDYDKNKADEGAVRGFVDALGDPYTVYMDKKEMEDFYSVINSSYCGIGVTVADNAEKDVIEVVDVFDGSPAKDAGIEAGDVIASVNDVNYSGSQLDDAVSVMRGEEGTDVTVTVVKKDTDKRVKLTLKRKNIEVDSVASEVMEDDIGYIDIGQFSMNTGDEFTEHLKALLDKGIKSLIIDVRNNGGGLTDAVESVADDLLPKGKVIYYTSDKNGRKIYAKSKKDPLTNIPIVILANGNSASASEILLGALKDNKRATFVGEKSYGKGVVQQVINMTDGTAVKVTVEKYFTPNGDYIHKKGINPDYEVVLDESAQSDVQLEKAIEILK